MSYILGIDTSSIELGAGLVKDNMAVTTVSRYLRNSHAEHITQCINYILSSNGISASDISHAAIATGPGSFTGLRIGIAFLKGFFFGRDARVLPVSSLESMAGSWRANGRTIVCASDARNNEVFWARFNNAEGKITRLTEDVLCPAPHFESCVDAGDIVLTDTLGYGKSTVFNFLKSRPDAFSIEQNPLQRGLSCAMIASAKLTQTSGWITAGGLEPNYLNNARAEHKKVVQNEL
jgi:tRNA threonylcarbamoyladenosine biosynthesis protein TsaB